MTRFASALVWVYFIGFVAVLSWPFIEAAQFPTMDSTAFVLRNKLYPALGWPWLLATRQL